LAAVKVTDAIKLLPSQIVPFMIAVASGRQDSDNTEIVAQKTKANLHLDRVTKLAVVP